MAVSDPWPCLICCRELERSSSGGMPKYHDGLTFTSPGNFGSRLFDTVATHFVSESWGDEIALVICDDCVRSRMEHMLLLTTDKPDPQTVQLVPLDKAMALKALRGSNG